MVIQAYSMEGFDIRIDGDILEMRTEGDRTPSTGTDPRRAFESFLAASPVRGILFDVRGARYHFQAGQWEERARVIARLTRSRVIAIIGREDQDALIDRVLEYHAEMGGSGMAFRSRAEARNWLRDILDGG
ncbi:hypothetical protein [Maricaulis sp.]|uniref:hypothetical protein n=1 Tax=Maricaulis sp. TaxID=1486257 RepID=UPI00261B9259|nr:hypothetical protein [Maricaulis sp.]